MYRIYIFPSAGKKHLNRVEKNTHQSVSLPLKLKKEIQLLNIYPVNHLHLIIHVQKTTHIRTHVTIVSRNLKAVIKGH